MGKVKTHRIDTRPCGFYDTLGACFFAGFGYATAPNGVMKYLFKARYGWDDQPDNILQELGIQTIKMECEFNCRAGFTAKNDRIPDWMTKEAIPENGFNSIE